jgi:hypothetical protein
MYIFIHSVWIRIAINADPDQNYPLCTQQTKGKCKDDFFPHRFCLDKKNGLQLQSYYQEGPKQAQCTTGNRIKKKCIRRLARLLPGVAN